VADACEHGSEPSGFLNAGNLLIVKNDTAP